MTEHGYAVTWLLCVSRIAVWLARRGAPWWHSVAEDPGKVTAVCKLRLNERLCRYSLQHLTGACGEPLQLPQESYAAGGGRGTGPEAGADR